MKNALFQAKIERDQARSDFNDCLGNLRTDLKDHTIAERLADKAKGQAEEALHKSATIATESKGLISSIIVLLILWFARHPLYRWLKSHFGEQLASLESYLPQFLKESSDD